MYNKKKIKNIRQTMILGILKVTVSDLEVLSFNCFVKMPPPIISLYGSFNGRVEFHSKMS